MLAQCGTRIELLQLTWDQDYPPDAGHQLGTETYTEPEDHISRVVLEGARRKYEGWTIIKFFPPSEQQMLSSIVDLAGLEVIQELFKIDDALQAAAA